MFTHVLGKRRSLGFLLAAGCSLWGQAPLVLDNDDQAVKDLLELMNTPVTSASKQAQRAIEAPSVISVVTRDQIQAYGWLSLNDILARQPGFSASIDFNHHTASSRGVFESFPSNHLLHLVDGIPMNDPLYGTAWTWDVTPLFMAKAVEILRGPGSALYGSNATNGVVHVKSVSASDLAGGGEGQIRFSEKGERIADFAMGHTGALATAVVGFNTLQSPGNEYASYDGSLRRNPDGTLAKFRTQDHHRSQYAWLKLEGEGGLKGWTFQYHYLAFNWEFGQGNINLIPDLAENLDEGRQVMTLGYESKGATFSQEYLLRYQQRRQSWYTREFPDGISAFGYTYPNGIWENVDTTVSDWFGRGQWTWSLAQGSALLVGAEVERFLYTGDRAHYLNIGDPTSPDPAVVLVPNPGGQMLPVGPYMEWILHKPYQNTALFLQFTSGKLLGEHLTATLGLRSDRLALDYTKIYDAGKPGASKRYANTSPRVALVFLPQENLAVKLMVGKAFRAPAPIELGASHSFFTLSNIEVLQPETINTAELAVDWIITRNLNWRTNVFHTKFNNEIGYDSVSLLRNLYNLTTQGLETELLFGVGRTKGFVNYSFAKRKEDVTLDPGIAASPNRLTWYPAHMMNAGIDTALGAWRGSLAAHYQGPVARRDSEVGTQVVPYFTPLDLDAYRPRTVGSWVTLDAKAGWEWAKGTHASLVVTNLLDTRKNLLFKNLAFPYDYQGEGRKVSLVLSAKF